MAGVGGKQTVLDEAEEVTWGIAWPAESVMWSKKGSDR